MRFRSGFRFSDPEAPKASSTTSFSRPRILLFLLNFIKWSSACIVMAIASDFIHNYKRDGHTTFQEIIACTSIGFFLPTMPLAFYRRFTVHLIVLDYIYSHLWVTAFIFAAEDYNKSSCSKHSPGGLHSCTLKYALESWCIIAVSFCVFATVAQVLIHRAERGSTPTGIIEKPRPSAESTGALNGAEPVPETV